MNDLNIYIILLNSSYLIFLAAFTAKNIIWLRSLTILGNLLVVPYYLYFFENSLWNNIFWGGVYSMINAVMLFLIYLERRPIQLSEKEQTIYDLTFRSLEPRVFKKLIDQGSWEDLQPEVGLVTRDTDLDSLILVVDGKTEVVLKHGEHRYVSAGGFIGEQSFITGLKTSADVSTGREATKILRWDKENLRTYMEHNQTLKHTFDLILTSDLIYKLRGMDEEQNEIIHSSI